MWRLSTAVDGMATRKCGLWLGIILVLGSFLPAVLVKFGVAAVILKGPRNHTAPIEAIVTFHCLAQGERTIWQINDTAIFRPEDITNFNGFTSIVTFNDDSFTFNLTMTVNTLPENNNTRIICVVYARDYFSSSPGSLTVIGPPLPPDPHLYMFSATTIQLSWLPPFSWADYPIVNYTVQVHNRATGKVINSTVNTTSTETISMTTPVTFTYNTPQVGVVQTCEELVFSVSAASNVGWSSPAVVTGGFPIAPRLDTASIENTVAFQFDGTPLLLLSIQLPGICPFQELTYKITIQQISPTHNTLSTTGQANNTIVIGPKTVVGHSNVNEVVNSSLAVDAVYSVLMEFVSLVNVSSNMTLGLNNTVPRQCSSPETRPQPTTDYTDSSETRPQPTTTDYNDIIATTVAGISLVEKTAVGVSVSLFIIITSAITLLLVVCGFMYWRRTSVTDGRSIKKGCDGMMPNPIYEGPLYESIQPELNTPAAPQPTADVMESCYQESPNHESLSNEMANKIENATVMETACAPPQRSEEDNKESSGPNPSNDDNYTIMSPIGTLNSSFIHGGWGIPNSESFK